MSIFLICPDSAWQRVTRACRGVVDREFEPAGDVPDGISRKTQTAFSRHATGRDVKTKAVRGAAKQAPFDLPTCKRCPIVRTGVFDGAELTVDVEEHHTAAVNEDQLALSWREFIGRSDRYLA
jgi:hypothetical protein